jgi:hypothetical protein
LIIYLGGGVRMPEWLASLGYVVITPNAQQWGFGVEDLVDDALFAIRAANGLSYVSGNQTVVMGASFRGFLAWLVCLRSGQCQGVVSLDGTEVWPAWHHAVLDLPYAHPSLLRAPVLRFGDADRRAELLNYAVVFDQAMGSHRHEVLVEGLDHNVMLAPLETAKAAPAHAPVQTFEQVFRQVLPAFLRYAFSGDHKLPFQIDASVSAKPGVRVRLTVADSSGGLPSVAKARYQLAHQQVDELIGLLRSLHTRGLKIPGWYFSEISTTALQAQQHEVVEKVSKEYLRQQPRSAAAHYLRAVVLVQAKQFAQALQHSKRALELAQSESPPDEPGAWRTQRSLIHRAREQMQAIQSSVRAEGAQP